MQTWAENCFQTDHQVQTNMQAIEDNLLCLKTSFSGDSAPSSPSAGQWWFDTNTNILKLRNEANSAWLDIWDFANDNVAAGRVKLASLAAGVLSADATGRSKMADLFITNAKINDVDGSKITDNTVSTAKVQNNAVTPSKMAAGAATLINWHGQNDAAQLSPGTNWENGVNLASLSGSYQTYLKFYAYIPAGAKYVILSVHGYAQNAVYIRVNVNGTVGAVATMSGGGYFSSSPLDISGQAGALRTLTVEAYGSGTVSLESILVQWYGA
jgi:hypothetical protein